MSLVRRAAKATFPNRLPLTGPSWNMGRTASTLTQNSSVGAINQYAQIGALWGVVNRIAESVSLTDWNLYQQLPNGTRELLDDATAPANHEATALWTHPNPWQTRQTFLHASDQYMSLAGEVYWLICNAQNDGPGFAHAGVQSGLELWPINPARISPVPDPDHYITGYVYRNGGEAVPIETKAIVQISVPDPNNPYRGFGPVQSMVTDLDAERMAAQYNRNIFFNDATPGGVISYPDAIPDMDWETMVTRWREQHQGVSNVGRVAMLERGGRWQSVTPSHRDMQFKDLRSVNRDNIFLPFGIHGSIMGLSEHINKANADTGRADFALWLLKPRLERYKSALNERIVPFTGDNLTMDYVDPVPDDRNQIVTEALAEWGWGLATLNGTLSALGQPTVDGPLGDKYLYQIIGTPPTMPTAPPAMPTTAGYEPQIQVMERELVGIKRELAALLT